MQQLHRGHGVHVPDGGDALTRYKIILEKVVNSIYGIKVAILECLINGLSYHLFALAENDLVDHGSFVDGQRKPGE